MIVTPVGMFHIKKVQLYFNARTVMLLCALMGILIPLLKYCKMHMQSTIPSFIGIEQKVQNLY